MSGAGARNGGAHDEVGLTEERRSSFEQSNPRASSTPKKSSTKIVDSTPNILVLEPVTEEKLNKKNKKEESWKGGGEKSANTSLNFKKMSMSL